MYKIAHLDAGTTNYHSFSTWVRRFEMKRDRQRVGQEITRFLKGIVEDVVVELAKSMAILLKNDAAKRDLVEMIHVGATGVEFISYLYANAVYFYKALESLSNAVLVVGKR